MKQFDLVAFNSWAEQTWRTQGRELLANGTKISVSTFIAELALRCDISVLTSQRYLQKHSAPSGEFVLDGGMVFLKPVQTW